MRRISVDRVVGIRKNKRLIPSSLVDASVRVFPIWNSAQSFDVGARMWWQAQITKHVVERAVLHHHNDDMFNPTQVHFASRYDY